jgi:hypothetical protein
MIVQINPCSPLLLSVVVQKGPDSQEHLCILLDGLLLFRQRPANWANPPIIDAKRLDESIHQTVRHRLLKPFFDHTALVVAQRSLANVCTGLAKIPKA